MPVPAAQQLALFESHPHRTWSDLAPEYERRRAGVGRILEIARQIVPESERRAAARRLGLPYSLDDSFLGTHTAELIHQHCLFYARLQGTSLLEHCLHRAPDVEDDIREAIGQSFPALIRIPAVPKTGVLTATDLLTGDRRVLVERPRQDRKLSRGVLLGRVVPFADYALMLAFPLQIQPDALRALTSRLTGLARSHGIDRSVLPSAQPRAFEVACIRASAGRSDAAPEQDLTLRALSYRHGFDAGDGSLIEDAPMAVLDMSAHQIPLDLLEAFDFEGIGLLEGAFGDRSCARPCELDEIRFETAMGRRQIRVYNRHISASSSPEMTRLHAFLSRLSGYASADPDPAPGEWQRALNWTSVSAVYTRRRAIMDRISDACRARMREADLRAAASRLGVSLDDPATPEVQTLVFEACLFALPEGAPGPLEAYAETTPFPRESEERLVLDRMISAEASFWGITRKIRGHGLEVRDLWENSEETLMLLDDRAAATFSGKLSFFGRLATFEGFAMAAGSLLPLSQGALDLFWDRLKNRGGGDIPGDEFAELAAAAYLEAGRAVAAPRGPARGTPATHEKTPRNAPCPCGSGRKFKHCCGSPSKRGATGLPETTLSR